MDRKNRFLPWGVPSNGRRRKTCRTWNVPLIYLGNFGTPNHPLTMSLKYDLPALLNIHSLCLLFRE